MKIVVVGTGSIGRRHLANLAVHRPHDEVLAVSAHHRHDEVAVEGAQVPAVADLDLALATSPDAVFVCNPSILHVDTACRAMQAGAHVYLEKPVATDLAGCTTLVSMAQRTGRVVAVGQQLRFHPLVVDMRERLEAGLLGSLLSVEANLGEHIADYHPGEDFRQSYTARADLGGGVLLTQTHQPDLLTWLFGAPRRVSAIGGRRGDLGIDVEDSVSYLFEGDHGVAVYGHVDYLQRPKRWTITVTGVDGRLTFDYHASTLTHTPSAVGAPAQVEPRPIERNDLFVAALDDFFDSIESDRSPRCSLSDATLTMELIEAIRASMSAPHQNGDRRG